MRATRMMALAAATALGAIAWSAPPGGAQTAASAGPSTVTSDGQVLPIPSSGKRGESGTFGAATPPPAGTAPAAVGPLTLASADSIIGADNRTKVSDTTKKPARMVALLTYGGNQWCSGFMIGIDTLVTSGHCVFDTATNTFYDVTQFRAYPGYDVAKPNPAPYGSCTARLLVSNSGWTVSHSDEYDYGALKLSCTVGQQTGWFGWWYQTATLDGTQSRNHGYPGDKPLSQWKSTDSIRVSEARRLFYANDTYGGNSGSPVFTKRANRAAQCSGWCVMAVHGYGTYGSYPTSSYNHGVRVTKEVSDAFFAWRTL
ncbi:MAG TPA: trypsin-like serine protease [Acidimicrobiales bacterium]